MSKLMESLSDKIRTCLKEERKMEMNILKTVYGELELSKMKNPDKFNDEEVIRVFKKFKSNLEQTMDAMRVDARTPDPSMNSEMLIYESWIPQTLPIDEIKKILEVEPDTKLAKSDGQAIGQAIGSFKKMGLLVDGKDVRTAVLMIREME